MEVVIVLLEEISGVCSKHSFTSHPYILQITISPDTEVGANLVLKAYEHLEMLITLRFAV